MATRLRCHTLHRLKTTSQHLNRHVHKKRNFSEQFKSSIQTESALSKTQNAYSRTILVSFVGTVSFVLLGNIGIQKKVSNFVNQRLCLDYFELKQTYKYYISNDLSKHERADPTKRLLAIAADSFVIGCIAGIIRLPMTVRTAMVLVMCKYYNQQSVGFMLMGLRGVYVGNNESENVMERNGWRARMDCLNYIRAQYAWMPIELCIYIGCVGSLTVASLVSAVVFGSHIAQFYGESNRTWFDKWANIQIIDIEKLQNPNNDKV